MRTPRVAKPPFPYSAPTVPGGVEPLAPKRTLGADYDSDWARRFPARFARTVLLETVLRPAVAALGARTAVRSIGCGNGTGSHVLPPFLERSSRRVGRIRQRMSGSGETASLGGASAA